MLAEYILWGVVFVFMVRWLLSIFAKSRKPKLRVTKHKLDEGALEAILEQVHNEQAFIKGYGDTWVAYKRGFVLEEIEETANGLECSHLRNAIIQALKDIREYESLKAKHAEPAS